MGSTQTGQNVLPPVIDMPNTPRGGCHGQASYDSHRHGSNKERHSRPDEGKRFDSGKSRNHISRRRTRTCKKYTNTYHAKGLATGRRHVGACTRENQQGAVT